ncbi:arylamine N-acetyltransferase [Mycobacterium sp. Y57]|uniref:arylamine N-acetyltransferase family protein n=1 Tax=Mycolicibacterium xanthum TaxID=2796469 RepID=UPI001C841A94|nr:arylamine N-acetyltransferase [Mycolicibacterium xanthum]MBX7431743.1 arylamine N-acetyltransferase [Mycolicibacterium xanthum]
MATDLAAYLTRIGHTGARDATLQTLCNVMAAHNRSIPFENLDPLTGVPVGDLSAEALSGKLVHRRRGGYCFEHNGLLGYMLEELGFGVQRLAGRVVFMHEGDDLPAQTHQVLAVTPSDGSGPYLVDVGFGGQTPTAPLRLEAGPAQHTRHERYRLLDHPEGFELQVELRGQWLPLYLFSLRPQPRIDLELGSWYVSTHPASRFVVGLSASLVTDGERWNLRGRHLSVHGRTGTVKTSFDTAAQVLDELAGRFGINLADLGDRDELEGRVAQVLDT